MHHVAHDLVQRSQDIKVDHHHVCEISPAPLPYTELKTVFAQSELRQIRWVSEHLQLKSQPEKQGLLSRWARKIRGESPVIDMAITQAADLEVKAGLVLAPFALDGLGDVLAHMGHLPDWFAVDGVLLFATLANGSLPELVNAYPECLDLLSHWRNIMDVGVHLQKLNFGLPVLDVETITLQYDSAQQMWSDLLGLIPMLREMSSSQQQVWQGKVIALFERGVQRLSLEVLYGQVWQPVHKEAQTEHTVSLESLTQQLQSRSYPTGSNES